MVYEPMMLLSYLLRARMTTLAKYSEEPRPFVRAAMVKVSSSLRVTATRLAPEYTCHSTSAATSSLSGTKRRVTLSFR